MMEVARRWREKADRLLAETNLLSLLRNYGEVHFSGGYAYKYISFKERMRKSDALGP